MIHSTIQSMLWCFVVAAAATLISRTLLKGHAALGPRWRFWFMVCAVAPFLTPPVLIGYAYAAFSYHLLDWPWLNRLLYSLLTLCRYAPLAFLAVAFIPRDLSPEAWRCFLMTRPNWFRTLPDRRTLTFLLRGPVRPYAAAFFLTFLLSFSEFEVASILNVRHWTVTLFDANSHGAPLLESARLCAAPVLVQLVLLAGLLTALPRISRGGEGGAGRVAGSDICRWPAWGCVAIANVLTLVTPLGLVVKNAFPDALAFLSEFWMWKETVASVVFGATAAFCAFHLAGMAAKSRLFRESRSVFVAALLLIPCLTGALTVALAMLALVQTPPLHALRDTPVPQVAALIVILFPYALILRLFSRESRRNSALFVIKRLLPSKSAVPAKRNECLWRLETRVFTWCLFLLFFLGYADMMAAAILGPTGMTTVFERLYNLSHYGQSARVSITLLLAVATPFVLFPIVVFVVKSRRWECRKSMVTS